jgi:hypothetical protein
MYAEQNVEKKNEKLIRSGSSIAYRNVDDDVDNNNNDEKNERKENLKNFVIGKDESLNAEWLKKYLIFLRLSKQKMSSSSVVLNSKFLLSSSKNKLKKNENNDEDAAFENGDVNTKKNDKNKKNEKNKLLLSTPPLKWTDWLGLFF